MDELKNCPFCGRKVKLISVHYADDIDCHFIGHADSAQEMCLLYNGLTWFGTREEAIYLWNMRADDANSVIHAHWIEDGDYQICSNCGEEHEWGDYRASYCDVCGAKMDEVEGAE